MTPDALKWRSKDGSVTPIDEMTDSHLRNTIKWLSDKTTQETSALCSYSPRGDAACDVWESAMLQLEERNAERAFTIGLMEDELRRRERPAP